MVKNDFVAFFGWMYFVGRQSWPHAADVVGHRGIVVQVDKALARESAKDLRQRFILRFRQRQAKDLGYGRGYLEIKEVGQAHTGLDP
jgi:hypothetical protein